MPYYPAPTAGGASITSQDEGTTLTTATTSVNYVGAGITATNTGGAVTVTVPGGGSALTSQDEGTTLTTATTSINYVGAGVTATNSSGAVTVTIPGGGSSKFSQNYSAATIYSNTGAMTITNSIATQPVSNGATAYITSHLPNTYAGGGITVDIYWAVDTDTDPNRTIVWSTSIMRVQTGTDDMNTESYAASANTASVTSGAVRRWQKSTVSFANGTAMDSAVANETIRVKMVLSFTGGGSVLISNIVVRET